MMPGKGRFFLVDEHFVNHGFAARAKMMELAFLIN